MCRSHPLAVLLLGAAAAALAGPAGCTGRGARSPARPVSPVEAPAADAPALDEDLGEPVLVIGAGLAGLAAACEASAQGAAVVVVDHASVFGGHAVVSGEGDGLALVDTPLQRAAGAADSPELAAGDFLAWGQDADEAWVRRYTAGSRAEVYDWLTATGVAFTGVAQRPGNRVARYHPVAGGGIGLVAPLFRSAIARGVRFRWNEDVTDLVISDGRIIGVTTRGVRDGRARARRAAAVILATGGFEADLDRVRAAWPADLPVPARVLAGSGPRSLGIGIDLAREARAALHRMDHQSLAVTGLPDPAMPGGSRGLDVRLPHAIWVNRDGARFVEESAGPQVTVPAALRQPGGTFWAILDADGARSLAVTAPGWSDQARVAREILNRPSLVTRASTIAKLARAAGLPAARLEGAVAAHNLADAPFDIARPPFYAVELYPLAQTSLGGLAVDEHGQVVNVDGDPIAGLYAAGEVTGFAGIAGRAPIAGSLAGASVLMGRIAGRAAAEQRAARRSRPVAAAPAAPAGAPPGAAPRSAGFGDAACTGCHPIEALGLDRPGWMHLAAAHRRVRADRLACAACHPELHPYRADSHRLDPLVEADSCRRCHLRR